MQVSGSQLAHLGPALWQNSPERGFTRGLQSIKRPRMTKPEAVRYRTTNWKSCNDVLGAARIAADLAGQGHGVAGEHGAAAWPPVFSDAAIQFCLMVKVLFGLPLRQCTGMVASILEMAGLDWPVPDFSTLSRRQKTLAVQISSRRAQARHASQTPVSARFIWP